MGSLMVGPIVAGPMTATTGWRSFWWLNFALIGASLLMVVSAELSYTVTPGFVLLIQP